MSTTRRADIQGLRAVAVLVVLLFHAEVLFDAGYGTAVRVTASTG